MPPSLADNSRDSEFMSAMLMSWYMSGYYTGLFHGRKEARQEIAASAELTEDSSSQGQEQQPKKLRKRNKL